MQRIRLGKEVCIHHWIIDESNGPVSIARCKLCGNEREMYNSREAQQEGAQ